jgi:hypothetical protein
MDRNDYIATIQGRFSGTRHYAQVTIHLAGGYDPTAVGQEIELHCGTTMGVSSAVGYEANFHYGAGLQMVRWENPPGGFNTACCTVVSGDWNVVSLADGDVVRMEFDSSSGSPVFALYYNGTLKVTFTDVTAGKIL